MGDFRLASRFLMDTRRKVDRYFGKGSHLDVDTIPSRDPNVQAVLINIFGGIVRCDMVARGVLQAAKNLKVTKPIVVRLEGTNVEEGQQVLRESGMNFIVAKGMKEAAEKVVAAAGQTEVQTEKKNGLANSRLLLPGAVSSGSI